MREKGISLIEALISTSMVLVVTLAISQMFRHGLFSSRQINFHQRAQEYAAVILTAIGKDLRTAARLVESVRDGDGVTVILSPTTDPLFPIPTTMTGFQPGVAFSQEASPLGRIFLYRYVGSTGTIVLEERAYNGTLISSRTRFQSDAHLRINNFQCWYTNGEAAMRVEIIDPVNPLNPSVTDATFVAVRYYNN